MNSMDTIYSSSHFSESNFINLFNTIKDLIFILDMNGHILYANRTAEERLGYSLDELIGQSVLFVHPEARRQEALQNVKEMLEQKREFCPIPLITKDGTEFSVETRVCLGTWDGEQVLFGVSKDISDLKLSEEKFEKSFHVNASLMAISDLETGCFVDVNQTFLDVLGYSRDEIIGRNYEDLDLFADAKARQDALQWLNADQKIRDLELEVKDKNGTLHTGIFHVNPFYIGSQKCLMSTMQDVTEFKKLEREIKQLNEELQMAVEEKVAEARLIDLELKNQVHLTNLLFDQPLLGIFFMMLDEPVFWNDETDKERVMDYVFDHHRITKVNQAMLNQYRAREENFIGMTPNQLYAHDIKQGREVWTKFFDEGHLYIDTQERRMDGSPLYVLGDYICIYDKEGRIVGHFGIQSDVTEKVEASLALAETQKIYEEKIQYLRQYDRLTGLLNADALRKLVTVEEKTDTEVAAILCLDIDNFRIVNESLGRQAADMILRNLAEKISAAVGIQGKIYRKDGDEFVVLLDRMKPIQVHQIAKSLQEAASGEILIHQRRYYLTLSIGISFHEQNASLMQTLDRADAALYIAKKTKNTIVSFEASMERMKTRETVLEEDLSRALDRGEFELYYQPIVHLADGSIGQAEALLRWNHPEFGIIFPAEFIPIAERTRLIIPLTNWVIQDCCNRMSQWNELGITFLVISINLSLICFENRVREFTDYLGKTVKETDIDPRKLKLEITESILMENKKEIHAAFQELKEQGFHLVMDDFGTGYSSIGQMKDLPIDLLKLDRSLVKDIESDEREQMITQSVIMIAHNLGMEVVAEGVETEGQLAKLKGYECDYIQGYLIGKPMPADEFLAYLTDGTGFMYT